MSRIGGPGTPYRVGSQLCERGEDFLVKGILRIKSQSSEWVTFRHATEAEFDAICELEKECYPEDEAATREALEMRLRDAGYFFFVAIRESHANVEGNPQVCGYICSTLSNSETLTHESMSTHEDDGETLCVHSVVVREMHRGQKLASWMLRHYNNFLYYNSAVERCVLLCKEELTPLYDRAGYGVNGESDVVHGATPWMEMQITYVREYDDGEGEEGDGEEKGDGGADAAVEALKALKTSEGAA